MYRPKSSSQLVIYPSKVRSIKFTVPRLNEHQNADSSAKWKSEPNLDADFDEHSSSGNDVHSASSDRLSSHVCNKFISTDSLGNLNPELYVNVAETDDDFDCSYYSDDNIGRVWIGVEYNADTERLLVTLHNIKNLPSRERGTANACDPLVRISLMPDERRFMQSKVKKKTCNPVFGESFIFQVAHKDLAEHTIKLTVYDVNRQRHVIIGHTVYPLTNHMFDDRIIVWRDLERELVQVAATPHDSASELLLSLSFNDNIERLTVGVFGGRHFTDQRGHSAVTAEFYVKLKLSISKSDVRKKRTGIFKHQHYHQHQPLHPMTADDAPTSEDGAVNPVFNESFAFQMSAEMLNTSNLIISAKQSVTGRRDKLIGRVVLGSFMFARGVELEHWTQMMSSPKQQISRWHKLSH